MARWYQFVSKSHAGVFEHAVYARHENDARKAGLDAMEATLTPEQRELDRSDYGSKIEVTPLELVSYDYLLKLPKWEPTEYPHLAHMSVAVEAKPSEIYAMPEDVTPLPLTITLHGVAGDPTTVARMENAARIAAATFAAEWYNREDEAHNFWAEVMGVLRVPSDPSHKPDSYKVMWAALEPEHARHVTD